MAQTRLLDGVHYQVGSPSPCSRSASLVKTLSNRRRRTRLARIDASFSFFPCSWFFLFTSGVLVLGVGMSSVSSSKSAGEEEMRKCERDEHEVDLSRAFVLSPPCPVGWESSLASSSTYLRRSSVSTTTLIFRPSLDLTSFLRSVYLFLIEKVYVVSGTTLPRLQSKMYLLCAFSIALYLVIIILMVLGKFRSEVGRKEGGRRA